MLQSLIESSLNRLNITLHTLPNETYNDDKSLKRIKRFYAKLGLQAPDIQVIPNQSCISSMRLDNLNLIVTAMNWGKIGNDRGGEIGSLSISNRKEPCVRVFREIFIDYRGFAHLCCNVYYDRGKPIGNVAKQSLEEIFCNNHAWRKALFSYHDKPKPCQTCKDSGFSKPEWNDKQKRDSKYG
ncbi:hypothetical protein LS73_009120 [Helicobacter muridarum]|uniref:4Fe4S-binding SPASM domain-containing protein n=1 Tax=Helicobacter muridarum TaxID=216 RepID=A0A099U0X6_9HELI|nr:SPASM domain-containing protein [Helicobacter muridarum]TLD98277.1 hypothetical protein LS73_009120 [Helicobacter muridarum]STQ85573.1 Uncharacterised protein [Helicobacter muridarum]